MSNLAQFTAQLSNKKTIAISAMKSIKITLENALQLCNCGEFDYNYINIYCAKLITISQYSIISNELKKQIREVVFDYCILMLKHNIINFNNIEDKYKRYMRDYYNHQNSSTKIVITSASIINYYNTKYLYKLINKYNTYIKKFKFIICSLQTEVNAQILMYSKIKIVNRYILELKNLQNIIRVTISDLSTIIQEILK
jgi:hypothetical protein